MAISNHYKVRPPHVQVEETLLAMLESLHPGDRLPSEPDLARQLGVSRATLREVIRTLIERGLLVRRHGVGTFVAKPVLEAGLEVLESIERMSSRLELETEMAYLDVQERLATATEVYGLGYERGTRLEVLVVNRVIAVSGVPVADLRDIVPLTYLTRDELGPDFNGSVLEIFLSRGTPILTTSRTEIAAVAASTKFATRLHVSKGAALLKLTAQLFSYDEKIVDYSVSYFVPGHFKFHVMRRVGH